MPRGNMSFREWEHKGTKLSWSGSQTLDKRTISRPAAAIGGVGFFDGDGNLPLQVAPDLDSLPQASSPMSSTKAPTMPVRAMHGTQGGRPFWSLSAAHGWKLHYNPDARAADGRTDPNVYPPHQPELRMRHGVPVQLRGRSAPAHNTSLSHESHQLKQDAYKGTMKSVWY